MIFANQAVAQGPDGKLKLRIIQEFKGKDATFGESG